MGFRVQPETTKYVARTLWDFVKEYLDRYSRHGNTTYSTEVDSRNDASEAYSRVASQFTWGKYGVEVGKTKHRLVLKLRPLGDAYSYTYRYALSRSVLATAIGNIGSSDGWVLDVGGAEAWYMDVARGKEVVVLDRTPSLSPWFSKRGYISQAQGRGENLPFRDNSVSLVSCLEVLEHLTDDFTRRQLLGELHRVLREDGILVVSTPQVDDLIGILKIKILRDPDFSHHGVWAWRRTRQELKDAGFRIEGVWGTALDITFLNSFLSRHPRMIIPVHLLNLALELIPFGRRFKFQTIVRCKPVLIVAG